jgi:teichuronic acid biosynthesis glycosyltransferase TuaH
VTWLGELPYTELPARLASVGVGLTPYADTEFNRSSFPLKTLEYIASGLPVVSTDLPAVRWLDTDLVSIAGSADDFADKVARTLSCKQSADDLRRRREFAIAHSWRARADSLREVIRAGATR